MELEHGGNLVAAASEFGLPLEQWIDLSTGISPWSWPVPELPQRIWQTLPYSDQRLEQAAAASYGCNAKALLAVPGSQYALQYTPMLLAQGRVAIPLQGYAEHRRAWSTAGHVIVDYVDNAGLQDLVTTAAVDHAVIINPNNPTGETFAVAELLELHRQLHGAGGWLIIDEAFADACPEISMATLSPMDGLAVYRSLGKYFGLAGIRLGFLLAPPDLCQALENQMPPWLLSHPARWIGAAALSDTHWQDSQRCRLEEAAEQWLKMLQRSIPAMQFTRTALFVSGLADSGFCRRLYTALARRAVLVRVFDDVQGQGMVRFGLPMPSDSERVILLINESVRECACVSA